jgi:hypothetical protein
MPLLAPVTSATVIAPSYHTAIADM